MATKTGVMLTVCACAVSIFFLSGCAQNSTMAGKDTLKDPFASKYPVKNLPRQPTNPAQRDVPLKEPPEMSAAAYERSGDDYFNSGNLEQAFLQYDKSVRLEPENPRVRYKIGLLFLLNKMYDDAILEFQGVIKKEPQNALAHEGMGLALFQQQKTAEAERYFTKAIELNPNLWKSHNCLGIIYDKRKDYPRAIAAYQKAIAIKQDNALLYNNLGISYLFSGNYDNAIKAFDTAMGFRSVPNKVYNNMGLALGLSGRYQEALETFKKVSDEATAYNNLGCVLLMKGDYEKANQAFERAIKLKPSFYTIANENLKKARTGSSGSSKLDFLTDKPQAELVRAEDFNLEELPPPKRQAPDPAPVIKEPPKVAVQTLSEEHSDTEPVKKAKPQKLIKPEPLKKPQKIALAANAESAQKTTEKTAPAAQQASKEQVVARAETKQPGQPASAAPTAEKKETQQPGADALPAKEVTAPSQVAESVAVSAPQPDTAAGSEPDVVAKTEALAPENMPTAPSGAAQGSGEEVAVIKEAAEKPQEVAAQAGALTEQGTSSNPPTEAFEAAPVKSDAPQSAYSPEQAPPTERSMQELSTSRPADKPAEQAQTEQPAPDAPAAPAPPDGVPGAQPAAESAAKTAAVELKPVEKQEAAASEVETQDVKNQMPVEPAQMQKPEPLPEAGQTSAQAPSAGETKSAESPTQADTPPGSEPVAAPTTPSNERSTPMPAAQGENVPEPTTQTATVTEPLALTETEQKKEEPRTEAEAPKTGIALPTETAVTPDNTPVSEIKPAEKKTDEPAPAIKPGTMKMVKPPEPKMVKKAAPAKKEGVKRVAKAAPQQAPKPHYHVVAPGDTLMSLSRKYNADVNALRKLNGMYEESVLKVGTKIRIR